ncbi:MAG: hypothetical protein WDN69_23100 [Aliidongia sp.]
MTWWSRWSPRSDPPGGCVALAALLLMAAAPELVDQYDRLFDAHDYGTLAEQLKQGMETAATARSTLAWEQQRFAAGSSVFIGAMYALDLIGAGTDGKDASSVARIRESAATSHSTPWPRSRTDGTKCAEAGAAAARRRQFIQILTPVWIELRKLPDDTVPRVLAQALDEESALAAVRAPDDYLCRGFTGDIPDALASGGKEHPPRFVAPEDWTPRAVAVRAKLPGLITEFAVRVKSGS